MDDETILSKGGTEEDISQYAKQNGADLDEQDEIQEDTTSMEEKLEALDEEEVCELCGGTGEVTTSEQVYPGEPHMADIGTRKCICQLKEESDMDDDS
jgi:hypothetical protein